MESAYSAKILIIDDEASVREGMAVYLEDSGYEVHQAKNGLEGLGEFKRLEPEVVLCDLRMPGFDGMDVLRALTDLGIPTSLIIVSGAGGMEDVVNALRLGATDYLIKPVPNLEVLEHAVLRGMERTSLLRENQRYRERLERANIELHESIRLLESDQQAGHAVQMKMFPECDLELAGVRFQHQVMPSLYLSGDFIDYYRVTDTVVGFYLADVSGHGASSAFVTILLKTYVDRLRRRFRNGMDEVILSTALTLNSINNELISLGLGKHLAIFCGLVDTTENVLKYSLGAHFPPPILVNGDEIKTLSGTGLPVGIFNAADYEEISVELEKDFSLILLSDGILEVLPQQPLDQKEAFILEKVMEGNHTVPTLMEAFKLSEVNELPDDIALLVVSQTGIKG